MVEVLPSDGENESIVPIEPTYKECFQALSIIRRKIQTNGLQCDMELNMVEEMMMMKNQEKNMKQSNITDFFNWCFYNDQKFHNWKLSVFITTCL